ncbi:hypothetical protein DM806_00945 [Sphingobium lactosutens]|nr:hypothetical protein [Sphingobium lactosutens]
MDRGEGIAGICCGPRVGIIGHGHLDDVNTQARHMLATSMCQCLLQPRNQTLTNLAHALIHSPAGEG